MHIGFVPIGFVPPGRQRGLGCHHALVSLTSRRVLTCTPNHVASCSCGFVPRAWNSQIGNHAKHVLGDVCIPMKHIPQQYTTINKNIHVYRNMRNHRAYKYIQSYTNMQNCRHYIYIYIYMSFLGSGCEPPRIQLSNLKLDRRRGQLGSGI